MPLNPISLTRSTAYFLVPGIITLLLYTFGFDQVQTLGFDPVQAFMLVGAVSFLILFVQFAFLYTAEGNAWSWEAMKARLRFRPMSGWMWFWTVLVFLFVTGSYIGLLAVGTPSFYTDHFPVADWYSAVPEDATGQYWLIWARIGILLINVFGEELLWRGFILPRQEVTHGRWAWLIHGVQWTLFHLVKPWELIMLLPGCIAYGILAQWSKNIWPGIIVHMAFNGLGVIMVTLAVLGIIG